MADSDNVLRRVLVIVGRICVCGPANPKRSVANTAHQGGLNLKHTLPTTGVTAENWPCFAKLSSHTYNMKVTA